MKTMKNFLSMAALALVGAMMTGCSSDDSIIDNPQPENKDNVVTLTTTVGFGDSDETRALTIDNVHWKGVKTFNVDDQIAVIYKNTSNQTIKAVSNKLISTDISADGKTATFTVTLTNPKASGDVRYIYPAAMAAATVETSSEVKGANVNYAALATQDGTLATLESTLAVAVYDGLLTAGAALPASASMANQLAILACTLKDSDGSNDITNTITGMTISDGTYTYTVTGRDTDGHIYIAIRQTPYNATITITATDGSKNYTKLLTEKYYIAGYGYSVIWRMSEPTYPTALSAVTSPYIGSVVASDGNVYQPKTAVPTGKTAVGILGKVTSTGHGLILALQDATDQTWNTINGWESVTTYAGTTLKLLPNNTARGSLASYTSLGSTAVSNWCVGQKSDYEAIFTNLGSETGKVYDDNVNAYITTDVGGTEISGAYWSATEYNSEKGSRFTHSGWSSMSKINYQLVRPVLGF